MTTLPAVDGRADYYWVGGGVLGMPSGAGGTGSAGGMLSGGATGSDMGAGSLGIACGAGASELGISGAGASSFFLQPASPRTSSAAMSTESFIFCFMSLLLLKEMAGV